MSLQTYWHTLQQEHRQSLCETLDPGPIDQKRSLILAGICASAALVLVVTRGYRAGFETVHGAGLRFPAAFLESLSAFGAVLPAICLLGLLARRQPRALWMGVLACAYAAPLTFALKRVCNAARPPAVLGDWVAVGGNVLKLHSFPSGHTVTAFVLAACFSVGARRSTILLFYAIAAAAGLSRVWLGVHWPVDVLAGAGLAGLCVDLAIRTTRFWQWRPSVAAHLFLVSIIAVCATLELLGIPEYPSAWLAHVAIAATALSLLARDYIVRPAFRAPTRSSLPLPLRAKV